MATMAADPVFVDTNVLVYATRPSATQHAAALAALTRLEGEGSALWVSPQALREYHATLATVPGFGTDRRNRRRAKLSGSFRYRRRVHRPTRAVVLALWKSRWTKPLT
jgi:predicted nucleic acid-binding protein